ncbi:glycosyltransferase family 39 protein [Microbacterium sediminicola]|uniref:Glycosyltransferase family 39 protein n=2 Tax=Microbacterium sediminicola TaxID=415210 RepID=A0ABN2HP57_9MICO
MWALDTASESNYYAAIAVSMSQSPSNFFFGAFDPAGTVTLDKIPGSFWIPALFVAVFGYSTWVIVLPNALAAIGTVLLVAFTGRRLFSPTAGLIAGAVAATTPIFIAVSRSNQPETFFVLCLALTAWAAARALTTPRLRWIILSGLFIALAFQTYMLEAWALWPALGVAYLFTAQPLWRKIWHLAAAGSISLFASLWWIILVSLIPASDRPYIGSTLSNNPWEMVFGYNGLGRFSATADSSDYLSFTPPFSGDASVFRLFNEQLAGQIAWLLPAAVLSIVILWMLRFPRAVTVFLGLWLLVFGAMFSAVAGMHQFYTAALAVPVALSVGLAFGLARRRGVLWPQISLVSVAAVTAVLVSFWYPGYSTVVSWVQALIAVGVIVLLIAERTLTSFPRLAVTAAAAVALVLTPTVWSAVTIAHPSNTNPVAGGVSDSPSMGGLGTGAGGQNAQGTPPGSASGQSGAPGQGGVPGGVSGQGAGPAQGGADGALGQGAGPAGTGATSAAFVEFLEQNQGDADYLVATFGAQAASSIILATDGGSVLPIGGFNGNDAVPSLDEFIAMVDDGAVRFVMSSSAAGGQAASTGSSTSAEIRAWVEVNCETTDAAGTAIYDCAP